MAFFYSWLFWFQFLLAPWTLWSGKELLLYCVLSWVRLYSPGLVFVWQFRAGFDGQVTFLSEPGSILDSRCSKTFQPFSSYFLYRGGGVKQLIFNTTHLWFYSHCFVVFQASWLVTDGIRGYTHKEEDMCIFQEIADFFNCCSRICLRVGNPL